MQYASDTHVYFSGDDLKSQFWGNSSDSDALRFAERNRAKFVVPGTTGNRLDLFKARAAMREHSTARIQGSELWLQKIIGEWSQLTGKAPITAVFWKELDFLKAVREGRSIVIKRFFDEDGWCWVVIRDNPVQWVHRTRVTESVRKLLVSR